MRVFCGIDWAEDHHDVALVDEAGAVIGKLRINDDVSGWQCLLRLLADAGDEPGAPIPVAIETPRGLLVACLRATGRRVYSINPLAVARYRERHSVARAKSDHADAVLLANIVRTDARHHRPLPHDSELVQAIAVLARAQQDAVWNSQYLANQLRSLLREYYPAALHAFQVKNVGLVSAEARAVLSAAPTPARAARLTRAQLAAALRRAGRQRNIEPWVHRLHELFHTEQLRQLPRVEEAMGQQATALIHQLNAACQAVDDLAVAVETAFQQHPDAQIITSFPGLSTITGARILGEIGDDRNRFIDARALKAYAGSAPITRASGKTIAVAHRRVKNQRIASVGYIWAFTALRASPGARAHYLRRKANGDPHIAAQRNLFNRLLGCLFHCIQQHDTFDEHQAFSATTPAPA